ncbi:hypothetical protein MASR2M50_31280 [Thauera sp.]
MVHVRQEAVHEVELHLLALLRARARGQVQRHHRELAEVELQEAALGVDRGDAEALDDAVRRVPAVDADAAVALLLRGVEPAPHARRRAHLGAQVGVLRLELLHAQEVGLLRGQPVEQALGAGRADPVEVQGDDA